MKVNPFMFRGYDLRGVVGTDLTPEIAEHIGKAYGTYLRRAGTTKAIIGQDCRATSEEYSTALIRGLSWAGIDTIDIGLNLVGTFYWAQYHLNCQGGVYVSASHNPPEYNGFKFANDFSETLVSESIQEVRRMVEEDDCEQGKVPGKKEKQDIREAYFADMKKRLPLTKKFRIVVDPSYSTAGAIIPDLFRKMGC